MSIHLGSRLRVDFTFVDEAEDGTTTPINLASVEDLTLRVVKPSGTEVENPQLVVSNAAAGEAYWDAGAGVMDQAGVWKAQGDADGYLSEPVSWRVVGNP